ncbi:mRNA cap methylation RNMT-activating mini family protein [Brugia pahangi]
MGEPKRAVDKTVLSSDSNSGTCGTETLPSSKESSNTNKELSDFPDLTDFVNQRTENDLDELFSSRYTMANKLYVEVANGFPDPVIVSPWSKRPKRNFDYTGGQRRSWREDSGRNVNSEWRSGWRNPNYDPYVAHGSRKRRNADADHVRVSYPGRTNS